MPLKMLRESSVLHHIIGVAAGKGGVGKSSVTVNLALGLKQLGYSVGILDADLYGPSLRHMLPESHLPRQNGETLLPAICLGIPMISMAYFRKTNEAAAVRAPIANGIISQFIKKVIWGDLDYLLIDFPPGTGDIQLTLSQQANLSGAVMVTTPQEIALLDVRKAMHLFNQVNVPIIGIVENMSYYPDPKSGEPLYLFGKGGGERLSQETGVPLLEAIPIDPELCRLTDLGKSIFTEEYHHLPSTKAFLSLAKKIASIAPSNTRSFEFKPEQNTNTANPKSLFLQKLEQKDSHTFSIEWNDGRIDNYRLSDLQKHCPCANCANPDKEAINKTAVDPNVQALTISPVGRYALRIKFTSGCSSGIYDFAMLRQIRG